MGNSHTRHRTVWKDGINGDVSRDFYTRDRYIRDNFYDRNGYFRDQDILDGWRNSWADIVPNIRDSRRSFREENLRDDRNSYWDTDIRENRRSFRDSDLRGSRIHAWENYTAGDTRESRYKRDRLDASRNLVPAERLEPFRGGQDVSQHLHAPQYKRGNNAPIFTNYQLKQNQQLRRSQGDPSRNYLPQSSSRHYSLGDPELKKKPYVGEWISRSEATHLDAFNERALEKGRDPFLWGNVHTNWGFVERHLD